MGWLGEQKTKHPSLGLYKILIEIKHDDNLKINLKWHWKMNDCAHSLKCFPYRRYTPFSDNYSNGEMKIWVIRSGWP
jgi:hypothetical protein